MQQENRMTRLMDVLKKREAATAPTATAPVEHLREYVAIDSAPEEALPYIEIDGLTRTLAGSPDVLPAPIHLAAEKKSQPKPAATAPQLRSVSAGLVYQPWVS